MMLQVRKRAPEIVFFESVSFEHVVTAFKNVAEVER